MLSSPMGVIQIHKCYLVNIAVASKQLLLFAVLASGGELAHHGQME